MTPPADLRAAPNDTAGLLKEIQRRDKIIDALTYQVEQNLSDQGRDYGLLQTTFVLEDQVRQRTEELTNTLTTLGEVMAEATAARKQLETAVETSSDGFALFDSERRVLLCNQAFRRLWGLTGLTQHKTLAELLSAAAPAGEPPSALLAQLEACRDGRGWGQVELPGGQSLRVRERRIDDGCTVAIYSDVTDLKAEAARQRQQELARKSRLLQSTLDTIDQGIAVFDPVPGLIAWNRRFFSLMGLDQRSVRPGQAPEQLATGEHHVLLRMCATGGNEPMSALHLECRMAGGAILDLRRFPMADGGFVLTASDITARKEGEERIGQLLAQQRAIFDNANVGILFVRERRIIDANARAAEMFGYTSPAELIGQSTAMLFPSPAEFQECGERLYAELSTQGYSVDDVCMMRRDGRLLWVRLSGRAFDPQLPHAGSIWVYTDVTDTHEQQAQLELAQMVFNHANEALMVTDADNVIRSVNMAFTTVTGYSEAEALGRTPSMLKSGQHDEAFYRDMWAALLRDNRWEGEVIDRHKSGRLYPKWLSIRVVRAADGRITNFVAAFNDISARKAAEEKIQHMAHHDALTGLPNRVLLRDRFDRAYRRARRENHSVALYFLDLDHFKRVNDTLGHAVGDELLVAVTQRLQTCLRGADTISRLGGDEFIVLAECKGTPPDVGAIAARIMRALDEPVDIRGHPLSVSGSLGIAMAPQNGEDFDTLLKQADVAMYHAKAAGRGAYSFFDTRMNQDSGQHLLLASALRHAPERGELSLVYQPQFDLAGCRPTGAEALMRWNSPRHGQVSPAQFIPLAEETGMINAMGEWALYQACRQARAWHERGLDLKVAVNISGVQIYRDDFAATVTRVLQDTGIAPHRLELELTESTLMKDVHRFVELMAYLGAQGVTLAIDDFGTGYSSLSYLKRFRVAKLKVDKSFVRDIPDDKEDCAIAEAIVRMGQALNLKVTAEGVETGAQFDFLRGIGCDEAQGYLLSAPGRAEDVEPLLRGPHPLGAALRKESGAPPTTNLRAPRAKSGQRARPAQA